MEQSTCRSCPVIARFALALLLGGGAATAPAFADDEVGGRSGGGDAAERSVPALPATSADVAVSVPSDVLRPRWVEPRRGAGEIASPGTARDWRRESRVLVHAERDRTRLAAAVEGVLGELLGARDVGRRTVDVAAATDQVRFFHAEDAAMAADLASVLELLFGEVRVRDLTFYRPQPARGALEVWLR